MRSSSKQATEENNELKA